MKKLLYTLSFIFFLASCQTTAVYTDKMTGVSFTQFKTYSWLPAIDTTGNSIYANSITIQNVQTAVNKEMQARGYQIDNTNPDLLIYVHLDFDQEQETIREPIYSTYPYYDVEYDFDPGDWYTNYYFDFREVPEIHGYDIETIEYTKSTAVVDIIRRDKKGYELIWRGWTNNRIYPADVSGSIIEGIEDIFDRYPVDPVKTQQ